jgi:hypothetical protein
VFKKYMIFLCFVHFNSFLQTFWVMYRVEPWPGTLPSQHYNNNLLIKVWWLQQLYNVCRRICFSGFEYYHNPKHSRPHSQFIKKKIKKKEIA